jgi:nicotinamidase-related amidase
MSIPTLEEAAVGRYKWPNAPEVAISMEVTMPRLRAARGSTALVTIDIQQDYFPGGRFPLWRPGRALASARAVLDAGRDAHLPIYHVRHESLRPGSSFLLPGTDGALLHPGLGIPADGSEPVVLKHEPDSFLGTELEALLRSKGAERVIWMGMMTWMCVDTTVRAATARGFENVLVEDACAAGWLRKGRLPVFPWTSQRAFVAALGARFATVARAREVAEAFRGDA